MGLAIANKNKGTTTTTANKSTSGSSGSVSYDKNTDYQKLINSAAAKGDYASAAKYEQQRNAKIDGTGSSYAKTNNYSKYLNSGTSSGSTASGTNKSTGSSGSSASSDWLKQAQANSQAWHTADAATRKQLEAANRELYGSHGYTYNSKTGTWTAPTSTASSLSTTGAANKVNTTSNAANSKSAITGAYANTDLGNSFWESVLNGATSDYLQEIADARKAKAQANTPLNQFYNDQNQIAMEAYISQLRQAEEDEQKYNQYYENAINSTQEYYNNAAQQAAEQYTQQIPTVNQSYDESARQAYINWRTAQRDLPEQLAAAGISGQGAAESSLVSQNNAYNSAYNQNELARQNAIQSLNNAAANAYNSAANEGTAAVSDILLQQANSQQNILSQQEQLRQQAISNAYNYGNMMGRVGGTPTLEGQSEAASNAYNNSYLALQQAQAAQSANDTAYQRALEMAQAYYSAGDLTNYYKYMALANQYAS